MKFLLGLMIGGAIGLLFAPAEGEETRRRLRESAEEYAKVPQEKIANMVEEKKEKLADMGARIGRQAVEKGVDKAAEGLRGA